MTERTGGERFPKTHYQTSRYCIAYLDMLGGADVICQDDKCEHLNTINMIFEDALRESKLFANDIFVKIFSDNILLAVPTTNEDRIDNIQKIIVLVSNIILEVAHYGYLMRGAITEGDFFHNDILVYGKALIEAVKMEEKHAIYPRVIAQKEIVKLLPQYFYKCADGWDMVNCYILEGGYSDSYYFKLTLLKQLENNKDNNKVRQKIMWAITDFNTINGAMRKMGALSHEVITMKEIETIMEK